MFTNHKLLTDSLPCGLVVTDVQLNIEYINSFALEKIMGMNSYAPPKNMQEKVFYTTDMRVFNMSDCMQNMIAEGKRDFHKTLIVKSEKTDKLVYFSVKGFRWKDRDFYLFNITDISDEMDCITHSPGTFGKGEFLLRKKIIGNDPKIHEIFRMISLAADADVNVLIQGESGTGKELVADAIHELSHRQGKAFVKVNCAALTETLLESELFGHVKGAFTGAYKDKVGKFEQANGGTIFLDEIGEISQSLQVKLLRVLQEKTIERVGDNNPIKVDMRIVAATNKDLRVLIGKELFREDLFYRLNVFNIWMPPLRERSLDVPLLIEFFIEKFNQSASKNVKSVSREAMRVLMQYPWPGNIRELQNAIEHAFVLVQGNIIDLEDLPQQVKVIGEDSLSGRIETFGPQEPAKDDITQNFRKTKGGRLDISKNQLNSTLERFDWNQTRTAEYLGISRVALWKKIKKMGL